jgi:hypothetical protein
MGIETAAMLLGGAGALAGGAGNIAQARAQRRRGRRAEEMLQGAGLDSPGFLESILRGDFNVGQDGGMQALRSIPGIDTLQEISETGLPLDTSELFGALAPLRRRQLQEGLGELRAGAPGIGQRFGSAMMRGEQETTRRHLEDVAGIDAAVTAQAHEGAAGRRMGASQFLTNILAALEQGRQQMGVQAAGILGGLPVGAENFGQPFADLGQLLLMSQLLGQGNLDPFVPAARRQPNLPAGIF